MKTNKFLIIGLLSIYLIGCQPNKSGKMDFSTYEKIKKDELNSSIKNNTIILDYNFGMKKNEIKKHTNKLIKNKIASKKSNILTFDLKLDSTNLVSFSYQIKSYNNKLNFFRAEAKKIICIPLIQYFNNIYGDYKYENIEDLNVIKLKTYYWVNGNREISVTETTGSYSKTILIFEDLNNLKPIIDYKKKFAGNYTVEVKGVSSDRSTEVYILNESGLASWLWIINNGKGGEKIDARETGTWSATETEITISIQGKSGMLSETYALKNNVLRDTEITKRYLKKTNKNVW